MNRMFDERLELQLQEYEFAELDRLLPARPLIHARHPVVEELVLLGIEAETGWLEQYGLRPSANDG